MGRARASLIVPQRLQLFEWNVLGVPGFVVAITSHMRRLLLATASPIKRHDITFLKVVWHFAFVAAFHDARPTASGQNLYLKWVFDKFQVGRLLLNAIT